MENASKAPQVQNSALNVDDKQKGTEGGPPGWMALAIVGGIFLAVAFVVFLVMMFTGP